MKSTFRCTSISRNRKAVASLLIVILVLIGAVLVVAAIVSLVWFSPGNLKTETMNFNAFTAVKVGSVFEVNVTRSDTYSVQIIASERIFDRIQVTRTGETLEIELLPGFVLGTITAKAKITMPKLSLFDLSGATKGTADGFNNEEQFVARVSGASFLEMTNFEAGDLDLELSGASHLTASGTGDDLVSDVSGASNLDLTSFPINDANVVLSGGSHITLNLDGRLDVDASGGSNLEYIGDPTMGNINTSGLSSVKKK
jgi:hypothetical protein